MNDLLNVMVFNYCFKVLLYTTITLIQLNTLYMTISTNYVCNVHKS